MPLPRSSPRPPVAAEEAQPGHRFHSILTVAQRLDVSEKSVRRYIERGELAAYRIGGQIRIGEADLQNFLRSCRVNMSNVRRE
jgi:excisionase family DNA binding protein